MTDLWLLWAGGGALAIAAVAAIYFIVVPSPSVPKTRRRYRPDEAPSPLTRLADGATAAAGRILGAREGVLAETLDIAGIRQRPRDFVVLVVSATLVLFAAGLVTRGPLLALVLALLGPVGAWALVVFRTERRRRAFSGQLEETLQMLAGSLRAGYSLPQAAAAVAVESEEPTAGEFARVINEARVGRPLMDALHESARRVRSEDFFWVVQAIAINREVGGNLADVLDGVGRTIRERLHLRRQVDALASEGKLSAIILVLLPPVVVLLLTLANPGYLAKFGENPLGLILIVLAIVFMIVGSLWLRAIVRIKF